MVGRGHAVPPIAAVVPFGFRALEKTGSQREGLLRESIFWKGSHHDSLHFSLLAT